MTTADPAMAPALGTDDSAPAAVRVLLIEDSTDDAELVRQTLRHSGRQFFLHSVDSASAMTSALAAGDWDIVLSDYNLPGFDAPQALVQLRRWSPETPFIVVSGFIGEEAAVAMMKAGADDYVMKDNLARLGPAIDRSLKDAQHREQTRQARLAMQASEARFRAIAANLPGAVVQLVLHADANWSIDYISEGSQALLGIEAQRVQRQPELFFDLILSPDSDSFAQSMQTSARELGTWNWEGRMLVGGDLKWVNLRSSPRRLRNGDVIWDGILSNITQNKLAELEIRRSREDLSRLSAHVDRIKEQERAFIAREIHDDLGGTLTAIKIALVRLGKDIGAEGRSDAALQRLLGAEELVDSAMDSTRRIATALRPGILDLGIVAAVEWQAAEFQKRMELPCQIALAQDEIEVDGETSIALFRIFQETLTNIAKHANASRVQVELAANNERVELVVRDDGRGLAQADLAKPGAFGLLGMRERVLQLGGELHFSPSSSGTEVRVSLPRIANASRFAHRHKEQIGLFGPTAPAPLLASQARWAQSP